MSILKTRIGGVWTDNTTLTGAARVSGAWNAFGSASPAYEAIAWPNPVPNLTDQEDGPGEYYNLGIRFHILVPKLCYGVQWRVPFTAPTPTPHAHTITLWTRLSETILASKTFTPTPDQYQDILFDTPVALTATPDEYVVSVYTWHYVHRAPSPPTGWTVTSPSGNVVGDMGRLSTGAPTQYPASDFNSLYYVSPLVGT